MVSTTPSFQDFEDFQYLQNYEDFTCQDDDDLSNLANDMNVINAFFDGASSGSSSYKEDEFNAFDTTRTTENTVSHARKCDECHYPFSEGNSPEIYSGCGHMVCRSCYVWCYDFNKGGCSQCPPKQNLTRSHVNDVHMAKMGAATAPTEAQIPSKKKKVETVEISREHNEAGKKFEELVVMREADKPKWNNIIGRVQQQNEMEMLTRNQNQWEEGACSGFLQPCAPHAVSVILNPSDQLQFRRQGPVFNTLQQNPVPFLLPMQQNQAFYRIPQQNQAPTSTIHHIMSASQIPTRGVSPDHVNFVYQNGAESFPNLIPNLNENIFNQNEIFNPMMMMVPPQSIIPPGVTYSNGNSTNTLTYDLQCSPNNDQPISSHKVSKHNNGSNNRRRRPSSKNSTIGTYRKICIKEEKPSIPNPKLMRTFDAPENVVLTFPNPVEFIMNKTEPKEPGSPEKRLYRYSITADSIVVKVDQNTPTSEALDYLKDVKIKPFNQAQNQNDIDEFKRQQRLYNLQRKAKKFRKEGEKDCVDTVVIGTQGQLRRAMKRPSSPKSKSPPQSGLQIPNPQQIQLQQQRSLSVIVLSNQQTSNLVDNSSSNY
ncbi:uncharacterized protein LOC110844974 isoform X2 [Folsomia candida]|uniref:uncharacterized protein LOC110844974 isoform X2 n=1 Tax=Folsomia candida TaxID=158441 RepID=UPI000B903002|nr:uncharacterized protein LOC110844974 isoform X2 [Folsomia candida]